MPTGRLRILDLQKRTSVIPHPRSASLHWDGLQTFVAVCTTGSIAGAANALCVNHSTVLRRLAALQHSVGTPLFDRTRSRYRLNTAGEALYQQLGPMTERIAAAQREMQGSEREMAGVIRLTTTDTLACGLLMPSIESFCRSHPAVHVQVNVNNQFLSLARREADLAIRGSNRPPDHLVGRHVGDIRTAPYASSAYLSSLGHSPRFDDMDWIAPDETLNHLAQSRWLARTIPPERVVMTVDSLVGMVQAVEHGLGAAMLLCPLADSRPGLVRLADPEVALDTQIWILSHPDMRQVARVRAFSQFLFETLSRDPHLSRRSESRTA